MSTSDRERHHIHLFSRKIPLPASRWARIAIGVALILGGILGWLPLLGFWMIPLGLLVLSYDLPFAERLRHGFEAWWAKRWRKRK